MDGGTLSFTFKNPEILISQLQQTSKQFKTSQKAFKKMFDLNMVSFINFMLQSTPLHAGIQRRYDDTVITLKEKVFESVKQYIEDINKMKKFLKKLLII